MKYFVYIARCSDKTLYTGFCLNLLEREKKHNKGQGSLYTKRRLPIKIIYFEEFNNLINVTKREKQIKKWSRIKKENLIRFGHPTKF